jgi:signal peptidase I
MTSHERAGAGSGAGKEAVPGAAAEAEEGPRRRRTAFDSFRENVEAIAVAIVLALIIRHFSVEAFEIPTGSMAPTLFGIHAWVQCPNCDTDFNIGLQSDPASGAITHSYETRLVYRGRCPRCKLSHHRIYHDPAEVEGRERDREPVRPGDAFVCPNDGIRWIADNPSDFSTESVIVTPELKTIQCPICWYTFEEVLNRSNKTGGHKILVDKFAYKIAKPQRWDVIVFQFDRKTNYIKRLIGRPGERVSIRGGDVYIDGHIERKYTRPEVQESLWTKVGDLDIPERGYQKLPAWKEVFPPQEGISAGSWTPSDPLVPKRWSVNAPLGKVALLRYQRPIKNYYTYNILTYRQMHGSQDMEQVGDKKVAFSVRTVPGGRGWIGAELRDGDWTFQLRIPVGSPDPAHPATLRRMAPAEDPDKPSPDRAAVEPQAGGFLASAPVALKPDALSRVEFENVDDRVAVRVDGVEALSLEYDSRGKSPLSPSENTLYLLAGDGAAANLESIRVYRDIHYTQGGIHGVGGNEISLASDGGENQYFPCGDNSPSSSDGRYWGWVPENNMMGRALLVFWPLWPTNWQFKFIR